MIDLITPPTSPPIANEFVRMEDMPDGLSSPEGENFMHTTAVIRSRVDARSTDKLTQLDANNKLVQVKKEKKPNPSVGLRGMAGAKKDPKVREEGNHLKIQHHHVAHMQSLSQTTYHLLSPSHSITSPLAGLVRHPVSTHRAPPRSDCHMN